MAEEKKSEQIAATGTEQGEKVPQTENDPIPLIQFLFYRIEAIANKIATNNETRDSREENYRTSDSRWRKANIVGSLAVSTITMVVLVLTLLTVETYTTISQKTLEANTRPYLVIDIQQGGFHLTTANNEDHAANTPSITFHVTNTGKLPALAIIKSACGFS